MAAKELTGGRTEIIYVRRIQSINRHPVESHEDTAPESILDIENWLDWNGDLDNPNDSEDDCAADVESDRDQDNSIKDPESPEQDDVGAAPDVSGLIWLTPKSKSHAEKVLVMVNAIETRRNQGVKKK